MAVTIDAAGIVAALRLSNSAEELAEVTRLLEYATDAVLVHVPNAPDSAHNEAVRHLCGYLYDMPEAARGDAYANSMRNSGAARMLLPYRVHRAGYSDAIGEAQAAVGSAGNPVTDVALSGGNLIISFSDGSTESLALPSGGGTDQTATMPSVRFGTLALDVSAGVTAVTLPSMTAQQIFDLALPNEVQGLTQREVSKAAPVYCHAQDFHFTRSDQYTFVAVFVGDGDMVPTHFRLKSTVAPAACPQRFSKASGQAVHSGELLDVYWWPVVFQASEFPAESVLSGRRRKPCLLTGLSQST